MDSNPSAASEFQRLTEEYRQAVNRCQASLDQLQAAERELNALSHSIDGPAPPERTSKELEQTFLQLAGREKTSFDIKRLSDREFEVFALIGTGLSSREIAEHLRVSISTIETYRERVKSKLNVSNGIKLIRLATIWSLSRRLAAAADDDST